MTLVSKDINLRIKAAIIGVHAEDYYSDKTIEDADLLYTGLQELPANFWEKHGKNMHSWQEHARTFYRIHGPMVRDWHVEPVPVSERRQRPRSAGAQDRRQRRGASNWCATIAANGTASGASPRAIANRISR